MRSVLCVLTVAGAALASPALAFPTLTGKEIAPAPGVENIHHKPGHRGGPPWTRQGLERRDWVESRPAYRRQTCETTLRQDYDPYTGSPVTRRVRTCY